MSNDDSLAAKLNDILSNKKILQARALHRMRLPQASLSAPHHRPWEWPFSSSAHPAREAALHTLSPAAAMLLAKWKGEAQCLLRGPELAAAEGLPMPQGTLLKSGRLPLAIF